jgi:hypothetical protein
MSGGGRSGTGGGGDARSRLRALVRDNLRFLRTGNASEPLEDDAPLVTLQVGQRVFESAPRSMRQELWRSALQRHGGEGARAAQRYASAVALPCPPEAQADIEKDLARTFPRHRRFASLSGQRSLGRVLRAYAAFDVDVGYCQGMSFVAALLLMVLESEADAFGALVLLLHGRDHALRPYYDLDLSALQLHLWQLGRLLPPALSAHLERLGCLPSLYAASWLMTCFSADFPSSVSQRVMDVVLSDSSRVDAALLKAAVALVRSRERALMQCADLEAALEELKRELPRVGEEALHDALTDAFCRPWEARQRRLLADTEGSETVAQAVKRVSAAAAEAREEAAAAKEGEDVEEEAGGEKEEAEVAADPGGGDGQDDAEEVARRLQVLLRVAPPPGPGSGGGRGGAAAAPAAGAGEVEAFATPRPPAPVHQNSANSFGSWAEASSAAGGAAAAAAEAGGAEGDGGSGDGGSDGSFSGLAARHPHQHHHHNHHHHDVQKQQQQQQQQQQQPLPPRPPPPPDDSLI